MLKISSSKHKFSTIVILLTFIFCFVFVSNGFTAEVSAQNNTFDWPLKGEVITPFGTYVHPVSGETKNHSGIDIKGAPDSEVFAAASGTVRFSGYTPAGGSDGSVKNTVTILHSNGYRTTYLQLKDVSVNEGDSVLQGQVIGKLAVNGDVSSPETHLHFGVKDENEKYVDPKSFLPSQPISSETSNSAPIETSDNSLSETAENLAVVSENVSTQVQSMNSEENNLEQVQVSESTNAQEVNSTQIVPQSNENITPQETSSVVNNSEAQAVISPLQEENKVANISETSQAAAEVPVNFVKKSDVNSVNKNTELKDNKINNEVGSVTPSVVPAKAGIRTNENRIPYQVRNDTTPPVQNDTLGQASRLTFKQTPKPQFANPPLPPLAKKGMEELLWLLTTLGVLIFSTELIKKIKGCEPVTSYAF